MYLENAELGNRKMGIKDCTPMRRRALAAKKFEHASRITGYTFFTRCRLKVCALHPYYPKTSPTGLHIPLFICYFDLYSSNSSEFPTLIYWIKVRIPVITRWS